MPKHNVYLELYGGSLSVLFNKQRSSIETVNDLNGEVVNLFRVIREKSDELSFLINYTPYSREEYIKSYKESSDDMERARRFLVRCWQGFGAANLYQNGFKSGQQSNSPNPSRAWAKLPEALIQASERLKGVQIEQLPALELIKRYDTKDVFIYADPPYLPETRKNYLYKHEMNRKDHEELLSHLLSHPGKIMLSGYDNGLYDQILAGWRKEKRDTNAENGLRRTETIWMNYEDTQLSFSDFPEVMP